MKKRTGVLVLFAFLVLLVLMPLCVQAGYIDIYEDTIINNNIATDSIIRVYNSAHVIVQSTSYVKFHLYDSSVVDVFGGNASYQAFNASVLNLYGGDFVTRSPGVGYYDDLAKIYVYGQNFAFYPPGAQTGFLTGNWLDENATSFRIYFRGMSVPFEQALGTNIFLVPEPMAITLILCGVFGVRKFNH